MNSIGHKRVQTIPAGHARSCLLVLLSCIAFTGCLDENNFPLSANSDEMLPGPDLLLFEDPTKSLTLEDIVAPEIRKEFEPYQAKENIFNFGFSSSNHWFHFTINLGSPEHAKVRQWLVQVYAFNLDFVETHFISKEGITSLKSGLALPYSQRPYDHRSLVFPIPQNLSNPIQVFIKLDSETASNGAVRVISERVLADNDQFSRLFYGLYFGVVGIIVLYSFLLGIPTGERTLLYYGAYVGSFALFQLTILGIPQRFLTSENPVWRLQFLIFAVTLSFVSVMLFSRTFLRTAERHPRIDRILRIFIGASLAAFFITLFISRPVGLQLGTVLGIFGPVVLLFAGIRVYQSGYRPALHYSFALGTLLLGISVYSLALFDAVDMSAFIGVFSMPLGSLLEVIILSWAVVTKLKTIEEDRQFAVAETDRVQANQNIIVHQGRMAGLETVLTGIAHEIGNPLNISLGGAEDLKERLEKLKEVQEGEAATLSKEEQDILLRLSEIILRGNERIEDILHSLKAFGSSTTATEYEECDIAQGLESSLDLLKERFDAKHLKINLELEKSLPLVHGRRSELNQVFFNLIQNAIEATSEGQDIRVSARHINNELQIRIRDNGPGVPKELRESIFDPFFTTKVQGQGRGLGLSICNAIIDQHGATISLEESTGGAEFLIRFPLNKNG